MCKLFNCSLAQEPFQFVYKIWCDEYNKSDCTIIFPNRRSCRNFKQKILQLEDNVFLPKIISITDLFSCTIQQTDILNILIANYPETDTSALFDLSNELIDTIKELALNDIDYYDFKNIVPNHLQENWHELFKKLEPFDEHIKKCKLQANQQVTESNVLIQNTPIIAVELGQANLSIKNFLKKISESEKNSIVFLGVEAPLNHKLKHPLLTFLNANLVVDSSRISNDYHSEVATFQSISEEIAGVSLAIKKAIFERISVLVVSQSQKFINQLKIKLNQWNIVPDTSVGNALANTDDGQLLMLVSQVFVSNFDCNSLINLLKSRNDLFEWVCEFETFTRKQSISSTKFLRCIEAYSNRYELPEEIKRINQKLIKLQIVNQKLSLFDWVNRCYDVVNLIFGEKKNALQFNELYNNLDRNFLISVDEFSNILNSQLLTQTIQKSTGYTKDIVITGAIESQLLSADLVIISNANKDAWTTQSQNEAFLSKSIRRACGIPDNEQQNLFLSSIFERLLHQKNVLITRSSHDDNKKQIAYPLINNIKEATWLQELTHRIIYHCDSRKKISKPQIQLFEFPKDLHISDIKTLLRNPYAFYAKKILKLSQLNSICENKNIKGNFVHEILEQFFKDQNFSKQHLQNIAIQIQQKYQLATADIGIVIFQLSHIFDFVLNNLLYKKYYAETSGTHKINLKTKQPVNIKCRADLIAIDKENNATIIDYKTGKTPSKNDDEYIQLPLEAIILKNNGFPKISNGYNNINMQYWQLNKNTKISEVKEVSLDDVLNEVTAYLENLKMFDVKNSKQYDNDYMQLARYEEWRHDK